MNLSDVARSAIIAALLSQAPMTADAMEIVNASGRAGAVKDGPIAIAAQAPARPGVRARSGRNAPANRPVKRNTQMNPRAGANVGVNRNVQVSGHPPAQAGTGSTHPEPVPATKPPIAVSGGWSRPDWYRWTPGGAVAAGAALGFVTAATATWAASPRPGLCWYYTDPTQQDGFWDACP